MKTIHAGILTFCLISAGIPLRAQETLAASQIGSRIDVSIGGKFFTSYRVAADDKTTEGLAILQHPQNPGYPAPWFTRDYGFLSPTPMCWPANGKDTRITKGEKLRLCYRVLVFSGTPETAGIGGIFTDFSASKPNPLK